MPPDALYPKGPQAEVPEANHGKPDAGELSMYACPRWEKCNAPICPLDAAWHQRKMQDGEPVCFFLIEAVKVDGEANFHRRGWGYLYRPMVTLGPIIAARWGRVARALQRAPLSGSRLARIAPWERADG